MGLFENMKSEPVSKLNLRKPVTVSSDDKLRDVIKAMQAANLGCAIVVDDDQKPVGMFTESMLTQIVFDDVLDDPISKHAADRWPQISLTDPIVSVLEAMEVKNIRLMSVIDEEGKVAGVAGQKGLMEYIADHFPGQVMVQRIGQKPYMQEREGA